MTAAEVCGDDPVTEMGELEGELQFFTGLKPSGDVKKAIGNGPVEIDDLPMNSMVIFHCYVNVYQRVIVFFSSYKLTLHLG